MNESDFSDTSSSNNQSEFKFPEIFCPICFSIPEITISKDSQTTKTYCSVCKSKASMDSQQFIFQIDSLQNELKTDKNNCQILSKHKSNPSIHYCIRCQKHLCSKCEEYHTLFFESDISHMFLNPDLLLKCSTHPKCPYNQYCEKCKRHLCQQCNINEHQGHTLVKIKDENKQKEMEQYIKQAEIMQDDYFYLKNMLDMFNDAFGEKFKKSLAMNKLAFKNSIYSILMGKFVQDLKIVPSIHYVYHNIKNNQNYEMFHAKNCWDLIHDNNSQFSEIESYLNKFGIAVKSNDKDRKMFLNSLRTFHKIDIVICGSSKTGKTMLIDILDAKHKEDKTTPTTSIMNRKIKLTFTHLRYLTVSLWDTPHIELNDKSIINTIKESDAVIYMIDTSNKESMNYIDSLHQKLEKELHEKIKLCGVNKTLNEQVITKEEGMNFCQERGMHYVEMNLKKMAKKDIEKILNEKILKDIIQKRKEQIQKTVK